MTPFVAQRITRTAIIHLAAPPEAVFPLFSPLGEKHWAAGWNPDMIYPPTDAPELGAVFTTQHAHEPRSIWTIVTYEPERHHIAYVRVHPDSLVAMVDVRCHAEREGTSRASVTYTYTGLSEHGNAYIATVTDDEYRDRMTSWEQSINRHLQQLNPVAST